MSLRMTLNGTLPFALSSRRAAFAAVSPGGRPAGRRIT